MRTIDIAAGTCVAVLSIAFLASMNLALYATQEEAVVFHAVSDQAKAVTAEVEIAKGLVALSLLRTSQSVLEGSSHPCSDPLESLPALHSIVLSSSLGGIQTDLRGG